MPEFCNNVRREAMMMSIYATIVLLSAAARAAEIHTLTIPKLATNNITERMDRMFECRFALEYETLMEVEWSRDGQKFLSCSALGTFEDFNILHLDVKHPTRTMCSFIMKGEVQMGTYKCLVRTFEQNVKTTSSAGVVKLPVSPFTFRCHSEPRSWGLKINKEFWNPNRGYNKRWTERQSYQENCGNYFAKTCQKTQSYWNQASHAGNSRWTN